MIKFLVTAVIVIICVFIMALMICLMIWAVTRLLRFLFPQRFGPGRATPKKSKKKVRKIVVDADEDEEEA